MGGINPYKPYVIPVLYLFSLSLNPYVTLNPLRNLDCSSYARRDGGAQVVSTLGASCLSALLFVSSVQFRV